MTQYYSVRCWHDNEPDGQWYHKSQRGPQHGAQDAFVERAKVHFARTRHIQMNAVSTSRPLQGQQHPREGSVSL
jgi:hypothetical protein